MKTITFMAFGLAIGMQIANVSYAQQGAPLKARKLFTLPSKVTEKDFIQKTIVFKLKPAFRSIASPGFIQHNELQQVLNYLGVDKMEKKFPHHLPPEQKTNSLGQAYADLSLIYELRFKADVQIELAINQMLATGIMEFAEPHYIYEVHNFTPNDPSITNAGQSGFLTRIRAYAAWDLALGGSQGDPNVIIGIVDSGTDADHPDLVSQFAHNNSDPVNGADDDNDGFIDNYTGWDLAGADYNIIVGDNNPTIMGANNDHGSHVSGCAAAATNNGVGVAGIGFNCKLLPVKCGADNDTRATGGAGYIITGYEGITYAADHGAKIINCSWGGTGGGSFGQTIIDYATINKNCLVVASAGNSNLDEQNYPGSYNYVLSVAATNGTNDSKASFSTYNYSVDISTPGNGIYETLYDNKYGAMSGTSMSSPITAGGGGLVQSKFKYANALQIGQRLKATADYHYAAGPNITGNGITQTAYQNKMGKGRMNLQRALTDATAESAVFANGKFDDKNDGTIVIGDSLYITGDFVNYLDPTTNLVATISVVTGGTYVAAGRTTVNLGAMNTLATKNNNATPFTFKILAGTPQNAQLFFKVTLTDGASYKDEYYIDTYVNVDYVNIAINDVATSITSKGKIGYNLAGQQQGLGFTYMGTNLLFEASAMIGTSATAVSDAFRGNTAGGVDADFQSVVVASKTVPGVLSEFDVNGRFNDVPASPTQNLLVSHSAYAWSTAGNRKFVIVQYVIKNNGTTTISNLFSGIIADWDIDATTSAKNKGDYDAGRKMGYVFSTVAGGKFAGIKLLSNTAPAVCYQIDNTAGGGGGVDIQDNVDYFSTKEKYTVLSTNRLKAGATGVDGADIISSVSSGPFSINAGDSVKVAFALIAGDDLKDLQTSADNAQIKYDGHLIGTNNLGQVDNGLVVFPNPANGVLNFDFNLLKADKIEINLFNTMGQKVKTIVKNNVSGLNRLTTDVNDLPAGTYFYHFNADEKRMTGRIIITK